MIEPVALPPRPTRKKAALVGVAFLTVLAIVAALVARGDEPPRLALVSGAGGLAAADTRLAAPEAANAPSSDSKMSIDPAFGYGRIEYRVDGELPDLPDEGFAWRMSAPEFDRATAMRMVKALGLAGDPTEREGGWTLETAEGTFSAYPGTDGWSINFNRIPDASPSEGRISAADAERRARELLGRLGVFTGDWRAETYETEVGFGWACAEPAMMGNAAGGATGYEGVASDPDTPVSSKPTPPPADIDPPDGRPVPACAPPPPPVQAQSVSFFPVLDGIRADWFGWGVTLRSDGRIETLYGTWTKLERAEQFPLRSLESALEELRSEADSGPRPLPAPLPAIATEPAIGAPEPMPLEEMKRAEEIKAAEAARTMPLEANEPAIDIAPDQPVPPVMPCGPEDCPPMVVTITDVQPALLTSSVWTDGTVRMYLVPAYRFRGTFTGGGEFDRSVIALHPDAIAPPPALDEPLPTKGGGSPGREPAPAPLPAEIDARSTPTAEG